MQNDPRLTEAWWIAVEHNDLPAMCSLIAQQPSLCNERLANGSAALHVLAICDFATAIKAFLECSELDVDVFDSDGVIPLECALVEESFASAELLIQRSKRAHLIGGLCESSLERCVRLRIDVVYAKAPVWAIQNSIRVGKYASLLHCIAEFGRFELIWRNADIFLTMLTETDGDGRTPLHVAAYYGQKATVQSLVALGASVQSADRDGILAVELAALGGHIDVTQYLLAQSPDHNDREPLKHIANLSPAFKDKGLRVPGA